MQEILEFLKGKKTYIIAAGAILTALGAYLSGSISLTELAYAVFGALGLSSLRAGVAKNPGGPTIGAPLIAIAFLFCSVTLHPVYGGEAVASVNGRSGSDFGKDIREVVESASAAKSFTFLAYPTYAPKLANQWGAGIALLAPIPIDALADHAFIGVRGDLLDGNYFAASAGVGLKTDLNLFGIKVTPFALTGIVSPLSNAGDKEKEIGAIVGTGATARLWENAQKNMNLSAFGAAEYWSLYPGIQIFHVGAQLSVSW